MNKTCPCCEKHCPVNKLSCPRGKAHFGVSDKDFAHHTNLSENPEEKMIVLLRRCGHFLHHNVGRGENVSPLVNALTPDERAQLEALLEKCLDRWQNLSEQNR